MVKNTGDGMLVEFSSVVDALRCAVEVQRGMAARNAEVLQDKRIEFRVGINVGDVIIEENDIYGDGVNIAARLETLSHPDGICVSARVQEDARSKLDLAFEDAGEHQLKNIAWPVRLPRSVGRRRSQASACIGAPRQAINCRSAIPKPEWRSEPGVFCRRNCRGDHDRAGSPARVLRHRTGVGLLLCRTLDLKQIGRELGVRYVWFGEQYGGAGTGGRRWSYRKFIEYSDD
jgi:adenylate cyclase